MKKFSILILMMMTWVICNGCSQPNASKMIQVGTDYHVVTHLPEMVKKSELVVIGKFGPYLQSYNSDRDIQNPAKPSKHSYSESKIYQFQIREILKGNTDSSTLRVSIPYSKEIAGLTDEKGNPLKVRVKDVLSINPDPQKEYVLFLNKHRYMEAYIAPFYPNIIEVQSNQQVQLKKPSPKTHETVKSKSNETYEVYVEGIQITNDPISGKDLDEIKQTIQQNVKK